MYWDEVRCVTLIESITIVIDEGVDTTDYCAEVSAVPGCVQEAGNMGRSDVLQQHVTTGASFTYTRAYIHFTNNRYMPKNRVGVCIYTHTHPHTYTNI